MDRESAIAWGCPSAYADASESRITASVWYIARLANWFPEHTHALQAMVDAHDAAAIREWADSSAWDEVASETSMDGDPGTYAEDIREALRDLADAVEEG